MFLNTAQVHITNEQVKTTWDIIKDYSFLITLILGVLLGFGIDKFNVWLRFCKKGRYFFHVFYGLTKALENQIKLYNTYVESIDAKQDHFEMLKTDVGFKLDKIEIVSKEDLYKIFISKHKLKGVYIV